MLWLCFTTCHHHLDDTNFHPLITPGGLFQHLYHAPRHAQHFLRPVSIHMIAAQSLCQPTLGKKREKKIRLFFFFHRFFGSTFAYWCLYGYLPVRTWCLQQYICLIFRSNYTIWPQNRKIVPKNNFDLVRSSCILPTTPTLQRPSCVLFCPLLADLSTSHLVDITPRKGSKKKFFAGDELTNCFASPWPRRTLQWCFSPTNYTSYKILASPRISLPIPDSSPQQKMGTFFFFYFPPPPPSHHHSLPFFQLATPTTFSFLSKYIAKTSTQPYYHN